MRLGLFGGSFNPVHSGHVGIAERAIAELGLDRLLVIPAAVSPFKVGEGQVAVIEPEFRLELVRTVFAGMDKVYVDDRELKRGGVSYAIDTVREVLSENPGAEIIFLIGEDSVEGLPRWKDYEELKRLCTFRSFPRTRESSTEIRRRISVGESIDDLVPKSVARMIAQHKPKV